MEFKLDMDAVIKADNVEDALKELGEHFLELSEGEEPDHPFTSGGFCIGDGYNETGLTVISNTSRFFPQRQLQTEEMKLIIAQVIKYTSERISATMHPTQAAEAQVMDSEIIRAFVEKCPDEIVGKVFLRIGLVLRQTITAVPEAMGREPSKIITKDSKDPLFRKVH